jgi:hypothetical protein
MISAALSPATRAHLAGELSVAFSSLMSLSAIFEPLSFQTGFPVPRLTLKK